MQRQNPAIKEGGTVALCTEYPILQHGGTEVLVRELIRGLAPQFRLVLVSDDEPAIMRHPLLEERIAEHFRWRTGEESRSASTRLAEQLAAAQVDLAHFHFGGNYSWGARRLNLCPAIELQRRGVRCLSTNHGVFGLLEGYIGAQRSIFTKLALLPAAWLGKMQVLRSLCVEVAVSKNDYHALRRRYWPLRSRFRQIYHSRLRENETLTPQQREQIVVCTGTIGPRKGQPYLAEAFTQICQEFPDWKLVFIGRPGNSETVAGVSGYLRPGRIEWIQDCSDDELRGWLRKSEVFAMPSLHEGLGLSLQEALFYGCACVASRIGGIQDLIAHNENGWLVPPTAVADLADALRELMRNQDLRKRFRAHGRESVLEKGMTADRMVQNYVDLYRSMVGTTGAQK